MTKIHNRSRRGRCGKVIFFTEIDAKIALARMVWKDKGARRVQECTICYGHVWHLTSQEQKTEKKTGSNDPQSIDGESSLAIG